MNRPLLFSIVGLLTACGGSSQSSAPAQEPAPAAAAAPAPTSADTGQATKPEQAKLTAHLKDHVKYPASRADLLAACADTPEFTAGEKQWIADHLPEGNYASADEVIQKLQ